MDRLTLWWENLPAVVRGLLRTAFTAALSGGALAAGAIGIDPEHFNFSSLKHLGTVFGAGAVIGLLNWIRQQPWKTPSVNEVVTTSARSIPALLLLTTLGGTIAGCALFQKIHLPRQADGSLDVQQLVTWANDGIQADCFLMPGSDFCRFGTDAIAIARTKGQDAPAVRQALVDSEAKWPVIKPYLDWLVKVLPTS